MKEHDYFLELMANPKFSPKDFQLVGLDTSNTGLLSKDKYKNSDTVRNFELFQTNGKFDEKKFDLAYEQALNQYNELSNLSEADKPFFRNDLFAPSTLKSDKKPEFNITKIANPLRQQKGFVDFGITEQPTQSVRELAEANVQYDYKTGEWLESPNDRWWNNFLNPKVLAQWDFDADENGNPTNDKNKIVYHKGEKKIDPVTGTYYYESLGGRNIYGREVLSGFDTLTTDGSTWNKYDFFDSDDIKKSTFGSLSRAVAQIAPVFIPYVNTAYITARVGLGLSEIMPTIGKIFLGSDNELMSQIEGWNKAFTFSTSDSTQGSEELGIEADPWTMETGLKLISDVFTQLAEQRFIFKYGNAIASRLNPKLLGEGKKAEEARNAYLESQTALEGFNLNVLKKAKSKEELDLILKSEQGIKWARAEAALNQRLKAGQDIAKNASMAYMTGITTASSYGEAKQQGATDFEAAAFALGYSWGEWKLLNSDLGKWILPELKLEKFENQSIAKAMAAVTDKEAKTLVDQTSKEEKKNLFRQFFDLGKQSATGHYADSTITNTAKMTTASALSEGFEETSEELLLDFSKTIFNIATELGSGAKFDDNWKDMATRYSMSFLGGTVGGGIATALPGYRAARQRQRDIINSINNPDANTQAYKKLVNLALNGKLQDYKDTVLKMNFGSESLSDREIVNSDGTKSWEVASSYEDSQDYKIKQRLIEQANIVENILNSHGAEFKLSDDQLLDELTRKQLKYYSLLGSNILGVYTNEYRNYITKLVDVAAKVDQLEKRKSGTPENESDSAEREAKKEKEQWTATDESELKKRKEELKEIQDRLKMYRDGTMANEFIAEALFEMTVPISSVYGPTGLVQWMEDVEGKKYEEITKDRRDELTKQWEDGSIARREIVHRNYQVFKYNQQAFNNLLKKYEQNYFTDNEENVIRNLEEIFLGNRGREKSLAQSRDIIGTTEGYSLDALRLAGIANMGLTEDILQALLQGIKGKVDQNIYDRFEGNLKSFKESFKDHFGFDVPQNIEEYQKLTPEQRQNLYDTYEEILQGEEIPTNTEENFQNVIKKINDTFIQDKLSDYDNFVSTFIQNVAVQDQLIKIFKSAKYITPATKQYLKTFINSANVSDQKVKDKLNRAIDSIKSSPLEELLSQMVYSLTQSGFDTTGMVTDLAQLMNDLAQGSNLGEFSYSEEVERKIENTIKLLDIAAAHINAARTEYYGTIGDTFGYNSAVNELAEKYPPETEEKSKTKKVEKLPELQTGTADSMLYELAKLRNDLNFYKALYDANSSTKLTEHLKQEAKINQIYYANIQKLSVEIPDDWGEEKSELIKAINDATTLKNTKDKEEKLSLEERKAIFKEKLRIEKAIYNLFQKHQIKDLNQFKQLFKEFLDFDEEKTSTINVDMKKEDNADFIWYIASLIATDPEAVYKEYIEATDDPRYTPVIGQEEAIRRAYSYLVNPETFEEFQGYINQVIEEQVTKEGKIKGFDVANYILSSRHFLIEGDPGSGKTSATYNTLVRMLAKNHPELLEDVWIVSNSEENAANTARELGLENVITLSKKQYFEKINDGYHQVFGPNGEIQIFEDELTKDEKGIRHYKNEKLKDVKVPKLILFDEVSSFSQQDLLLSDKFLRKNNLYSLVAGDFKQLGAQGWVLSKEKDKKGDYQHFQDEDGQTIYLGLGNANFIGSWKLGTSMRSNNSYKSGNVAKIKLAFDTIFQNIEKINTDQPISPITFSYHENPEKGLFGDKVETDVDKAVDTIKVMLKTLSTGEKINFITDNPGSELALAIKDLNESEEYKDKFNIVSAGASQGQEGQYYIIDLQNTYNHARTIQHNNEGKKSISEVPATENFVKAFYTALSRAKQGSLVFGHYGHPNDAEKVLFNSIPQAKYQENNLSQSIKDANSKERKDIINSAIENKDAATPPINWSSAEQKQQEEPEQEEIVPDEEIVTKEEVQKRNIDPPAVIKNEEEGKLNILIHTFMCNETGCKVIDSSGNLNTTMDPMEDEAQLQLGDFHEDRIDNIHGLIKLFENSGIRLPFETYDDEGKLVNGVKINDQGIITEGKKQLITLLNQLREAGRNCDDYNTLVTVIQNLLGTDKALGIDFIYDQYYEDYNGDTKEAFENDEKLADYKERYKGQDENLSGIINDDNEEPIIRQPRNAVISMVITLENGKKLVRIPLAKLTSPLTLLGQEEFKEIKEIYDKEGGNLTRFKKAIKQALINKENIPHLKEFAMLLDIYQGTAFNNIAYLNKLFNGTLAGFAQPTGITITSKPKGEEYLQNEKYYYRGKWVSLSKYKKLMPWRNVSQIMVCVDKNPIIKNNKQITPGKPFVLVTDDPLLQGVSSEVLLKEYVKQIKDSTSKPRIKLIEVIPPSLETERYLFNLYTALNTHKNKSKEVDKDLGTKNTAFRLLSQVILKQDSPFITEYEKFIKDNIKDKVVKINGQDVNLYKKTVAEFKALQTLVKALLDYEKKNDTHSLYNLLNSPVTSLDKNNPEIKSILDLLKYNVEGESKPRFLQPTNNDKLTLRHLFQRKLNEMLFNTALGNSEKVVKKNGDIIEYLKPEIEQRVKAFIDTVEWKEVQLHTRVKIGSNFDPIEIDDETNLNIALVETNYGNDYAIGKDGGEYQINGKIDSTQYSLDIVPMLKWILTGALGRDPDIIDTDMDNENIFAVTDKAMQIKKGNNVHYYEETPSERETEEEKLAKKQLEQDTKKLREITPRDFSKKGLGKKNDFIDKFAELDEESRKKVLEDPREFIYQTLGILCSKQDDGKYKFFTSEEIKKAQNVKFNSDGTTSFILNGDPWILNKDEAVLDDSKFIIPEGAVKIINNTIYGSNAYSAKLIDNGENNFAIEIYDRNGNRIAGGSSGGNSSISEYNELTGSNIPIPQVSMNSIIIENNSKGQAGFMNQPQGYIKNKHGIWIPVVLSMREGYIFEDGTTALGGEGKSASYYTKKGVVAIQDGTGDYVELIPDKIVGIFKLGKDDKTHIDITEEIQEEVNQSELSQQFKDDVSDALIKINPNSSDYEIFLTKDGKDFNMTDGYATYSDIIAIHILTKLGINKIRNAMMNPTEKIGKRKAAESEKKTFAELVQILNEHPQEFQYIKEEINKYLGKTPITDSEKYIEEHNNCGTLPF